MTIAQQFPYATNIQTSKNLVKTNILFKLHLDLDSSRRISQNVTFTILFVFLQSIGKRLLVFLHQIQTHSATIRLQIIARQFSASINIDHAQNNNKLNTTQLKERVP